MDANMDANMEERGSLLIDLASENLGGEVIYASNEWFAAASNLLKEGRAKFDPDSYIMTGKEMDGWESGRHSRFDPERNGSDFCIIKLGVPGHIVSVDIDTLHFTGNYAEAASIEAIDAPSNMAWFDLNHQANWTMLVPKTQLCAGTPDLGHNVIEVDNTNAASKTRYTHIRLTIFPDGGVSRLRVMGHAIPDWDSILKQNIAVDLALLTNGGIAVASSNSYYSHPDNLLLPARAKNMSSGWESARSRSDGHTDWAIIKLGRPCLIHAIEVDTAHFRGNFPHLFRIEVAYIAGAVSQSDVERKSDQSIAGVTSQSDVEWKWDTLVHERKGRGHYRMVLLASKADHIDTERARRPVSHVRLVCIPDGGVSRLRVFGRPI